ncbi:MAG: efflux transporter outer membrane subunit [Parvibaculaceae bacterium]|nr:efflux transporter outer membrane subunit [Parvibaculaceae bacterium]
MLAGYRCFKAPGRVLGASALFLTVAACTLSPNVPDPKVSAPVSFKEATPAMSAVWPELGWWQGFGSPELDRLMAQTQDSNLDIAAAIARIEQADAQIKVSGSSLYPSLSASGQGERSRRGTGGSNSGLGDIYQGSNSRISNSYNAGLTASYELDFWGGNRAALESARQSALASRYDKETVALTATTSTATTYFAILAAQDRLALARDNLRIAEQTLDVIKARSRVGVATELDLANQETIVAQQRAAIPPLELDLTQNINALAILTGHAPEEVQVTGGKLAGLKTPVVVPGLPSELLARRPDVREAEANLSAARANVQVARAAMFPNITLTATGGYESSALSQLFTPGGFFSSLTGGLTQPLFEGFALQGQLEANKAAYRELMATYQKTIISAFSDVDDALASIRRTTEQEQQQELVVASAQRAYDIAQAQLRVGVVDITDVLNAEQTLFSDRDALAQVRLSRINAVVSLFQALGGGWTEPTQISAK